MELGTNDLKMMITECVQRILEYHGAIDDSFEKLAEIILKKLKTEKKFTLTPRGNKCLLSVFRYKETTQRTMHTFG